MPPSRGEIRRRGISEERSGGTGWPSSFPRLPSPILVVFAGTVALAAPAQRTRCASGWARKILPRVPVVERIPARSRLGRGAPRTPLYDKSSRGSAVLRSMMRSLRGPYHNFAQEAVEDPEYVPEAANRLDLYAITGTHGLKGELKAHMLTDSVLEEWDRVWIRHPRSQEPRRIFVTSNRETTTKGGRLENIIKIEGIDTKDQAQEIVGGSIFADGTEDFGDFEGEDEEEAWPEMWDKIDQASDVIGFTVLLTKTEEVIGEVESIDTNGFQDILVIRYLEKDKTFLVPFVEAVVPIVDTEERAIALADIEGLW